MGQFCRVKKKQEDEDYSTFFRYNGFDFSFLNKKFMSLLCYIIIAKFFLGIFLLFGAAYWVGGKLGLDKYDSGREN